jgi:hypothetical protein
VKSLQTTDDGRQVMAIVHLDLRSRWTNKKYIMLNDFIVRHKSTFSDFMEIYVWKNLYRIFVRM